MNKGNKKKIKKHMQKKRTLLTFLVAFPTPQPHAIVLLQKYRSFVFPLDSANHIT
jgi:hypothetical protein